MLCGNNLRSHGPSLVVHAIHLEQVICTAHTQGQVI